MSFLRGAAVGVVMLAACHAPGPDDNRSAKQVADPTFTRDIAPIIFDRCTPCHRPGQAVPFTLTDYSDVRQHAREIAAATKSRFMPPWLPEPGYGEFAHERRLQNEEVEMIRRWVERGTIEGDHSDLPPAPKWPQGWRLGEPNLVVRFPQPYTLRSGKADVFRNFVIPVPLPSTRYVRAIEFQPGNPKILHHATIGIDRTRSSRRRDEQDREPGYEGMLSETVQSPDGHFVGWTPGKTPTVQPEDMSWPLEPGTDLVIQLHMLPADEAESIQPSIGFFFTERPPTRTSVVIKLGSKTINIPAGQKDYTIKDTYTLPVDVEALSVYPHAHYLAKDMKGVSTLPDGTVKWLIWIKGWDFHRQDQYEYAAPLSLPRGTVLTMQYTYDNSAENERNPNDPPRRVTFGPQSSDEMGDLWLQVVPRNSLDAAILARDYVQRELSADIASGEMMIQLAPDDALMRNFLGVRYLQAGRLDDAINRFREALRLNPKLAEAHNNLGNALQFAGRTGEAVEYFRRALLIVPRDDRVHFNLGNALKAIGREDEAIREFQQTIAINPDFADAYNNLGVALASQHKLEEAVRQFERALRIKPDYADAHNNLGLALASTGNVVEAIRHVRRALEIRPDYADADKNLQLLLRSIGLQQSLSQGRQR